MYKLDDQTLRWDVGCSAAHDHRPFEEDDQTEGNPAVLNRGRHFIGHLRLELPANPFTGGSCMAALLGDGDRALRFLNGLKSFLTPNTFYYEIDNLPVMETPLHGATSMQEMLLQRWDGRLRIFPAVPSEWPDVQIHHLRGEGAFLVSARREHGKTQWVLVHSECGGSVEVQPQLANAQGCL